MAKTIKIVAGDTRTRVRFEIKNEESADEWDDMTSLDLADIAEVVLRVKSMAENRIIGEIACDYRQTIDPETQEVTHMGEVQVTVWGDTWNCDPGVYQGELETRWHDGTIQTVHNTVRFKVRPQFDQ